MPEPIRHGKNIMELTTVMSKYKQIEYPQWGVMGQRDLIGANFSVGASYLTKPVAMVGDAHSHGFDQVLLFLGGDPKNVKDFDAEVELLLVDKFELINFAACVHVPAGTVHCPLIVKKVNKPFIFMDVTLSPNFSDRPPSKVTLEQL